jgi:hypothetical protein
MRLRKASLALVTLFAALAAALASEGAAAVDSGSDQVFTQSPPNTGALARRPSASSRATTSAGPGEIWLTETGGLVRFRSSQRATTTSGGPWDRGLPRTIGISRMDRGMSGRARSPDKYYPTGQSSRTRTDIRVPMRRFRQ